MTVIDPPIQQVRIISVREELWPRFERLVDQAALVLEVIPSGPSQRGRYELTTCPRRAADALLTNRELQVLHGIAEGWMDREIGAHLDIGITTVKRHEKNLYGKLGAAGRANAVLLACRAGILS